MATEYSTQAFILNSISFSDFFPSNDVIHSVSVPQLLPEILTQLRSFPA